MERYYANSNSYVLYRLMLFPVPSVTLTTNHPIFTFCIAFHIYVVSADRDFKFGR